MVALSRPSTIPSEVYDGNMVTKAIIEADVVVLVESLPFNLNSASTTALSYCRQCRSVSEVTK